MQVTITAAHNLARLAGTLSFLNLGTGNASIELHDASGNLLVTVALAKPAGAVTADGLVLQGATADGELIVASGVAVTALFKNGNGDLAMTTDVSDASGTGAVKLPTTQLYAGGRCPLSTSVIG